MISRTFLLFESIRSIVCPTLALFACHHSTVLYLLLKTPICGGLFPKSVNIWLPAFLHYLRKAYRFCFKEFHGSAVTGGSVSPTVPEKVRQRTTARRIRLPLLHSCPGGIRRSSIHSP